MLLTFLFTFVTNIKTLFMILTTDVPKMSDNQLKGTLKEISELLNAIVLEQEKRENEGGK